MEKYLMDIIKDAFNRCYGLRDMLSNESMKIKKPAIDLLSAQTGISVKYLIANLEEIKRLWKQIIELKEQTAHI